MLVMCTLTVHAANEHLQNPADSIYKNLEIDNIVLYQKKISSNIIPTQSLDSEQLQRLSVHSVADAIRYFSGVQIKDYGGIGGLKTVNIRSLGSQHVGVFYDGIELGNAQNGTVDLGRFSLDNMESVSLYNAQKSSTLQSAKDFAASGTIYMQTRTPSFEQGKDTNLKLSFKTGSFGTLNPSLLYEQKLSDNISASFSGEYLYTTGEYKFTYSKADGYDTTAMRENGDLEMYRLEGALFGTINNGSWRAKVYYYNSERGYPGAVVREEPEVFKNEDRQWDQNLFAQGSLRKSISSRYSFLINAKYAYDYLHYLSDPREDVSTMYVNNKYIQQEYYGSMANQFILTNNWSANLAVDYLRNSLDADLTDFVYPIRNTMLGALASSLELGRVKMQGSLLFTYVSESVSGAAASADDYSVWTPTLLASYKPFSDIDLNVRALYKRIFRMPTLNDLYYTYIGNIDLDPEYTTQYNLGLGYNLDLESELLRNLNLQLDVYYNQVDNKIVAMPTSSQFRWTMVNLGKCEIRGIDLVTRSAWQLGRFDIDLGLNYTYQKAQDFTDPTSEFYGGQIPYIPWHSGSAVVATTFKTWELNYSFIYTGERYESQANIAENYCQPWYTHDMSLSKTLTLRSYPLRLTAEVNNILNQQYEVVQCYPMPGTNLKFIINLTL